MPSQNEIAQSLADYLNRQAAVDCEVTPEADLLESGVLESLTMMELIVHIQERYGVILEPGDIAPANFRSTIHLARLVTEKLKPGAEPSLRVVA